MRYMKFAVAGLLLAAFALVFANSADAKLNLRIVNNTNRKIFVALMLDGGAMASTKGWYSVDAGGDKSFVWDVEVRHGFGYYAMNSPAKGEKKSYWRGKKGEEDYPIHPTKNFDYNIAFGGDDNMNNYGDDAQFVSFRELQHKKTGEIDASATLTFK